MVMRLRLATTCILMIAALVSVEGQDSITLSASLRFEFVGKTSLFTIPVFVNGRGPYRFLLDTGASHTLLSKTVAKELAIRGGTTENLTTASGSVSVTTRALDTLQMGGIRIERPRIAVAEFGLLGTLTLTAFWAAIA